MPERNDRGMVLIDTRNARVRRSIERAKLLHPTVHVINADLHVYCVPSQVSDKTYTVRLEPDEESEAYWGECFDDDGADCNGFYYGGSCYHMASAAAVAMGLDGMREHVQIRQEAA